MSAGKDFYRKTVIRLSIITEWQSYQKSLDSISIFLWPTTDFGQIVSISKTWLDCQHFQDFAVFLCLRVNFGQVLY